MRLRLEQTTDNQRLCPSGNEQRSDKRGSLSHGERSLTKEQYAEEERELVLLLATFVAKPALSPSHRKRRVARAQQHTGNGATGRRYSPGCRPSPLLNRRTQFSISPPWYSGGAVRPSPFSFLGRLKTNRLLPAPPIPTNPGLTPWKMAKSNGFSGT